MMKVLLMLLCGLDVLTFGFLFSSLPFGTHSRKARFSSSRYMMSGTTVVGVCVEPGADSFFKIKPELSPVPWTDALEHISEKLGWDGDDVELKIIHPQNIMAVSQGPHRPDILMLVDLKESSFEIVKEQGDALIQNCKAVKVFDSPECFRQLEKFGDYDR